MTVEYTRPPLINAEKLLYCDRTVIDAIALAAVVSMVEGTTDMVVDCESEYPTKKDIEDCLAASDQRAIEFLDDAFADLKQRVVERIKEGKFNIRVRALKYCHVDGGLDDVHSLVELVE